MNQYDSASSCTTVWANSPKDLGHCDAGFTFQTETNERLRMAALGVVSLRVPSGQLSSQNAPLTCGGPQGVV